MYPSYNKPKLSFWIIGIVAFVWNCFGVLAYLSSVYMTDEVRALLPENQQTYIANTPTWVTAIFAIAVFSGVIGSLLLLLKKKIAIPVFLLSLIAVIIQMLYSFIILNAFEVFGISNLIMSVLVIIIAVFLYGYSKKAKFNRWLI